MSLPFMHPSSIVISGPSGSGKTVFMRRLLTCKMIHPFPTRIMIVYGEWQKEYETLQEQFANIEFIKGPLMEGLHEKFDPTEKNILILDDQMGEIENSKELVKLFTQGSHHRNLTVVLLLQNFFQKGKSIRTATLNAKYIVLFKNPRDKVQATVLGRQMYPFKGEAFISALEDATLAPFSYLVIDLLPRTADEYRLRTNIFPDDPSPGAVLYIIGKI